jgi:hypothetical protein
VEVFSREIPKTFRIFLAPKREKTDLKGTLEEVADYSDTVSRRDISREGIALWTSTHKGFRIRDSTIARRALATWQNSATNDEAIRQLANDDSAHLFLNELLTRESLPDSPSQIRRTPQEIARYRDLALSKWAEKEPLDPSDDGYRLRFARDRDRILWSNGIRQLANKTQVFSTSESDYIRQRLTHSTEVFSSQVPSEIAWGWIAI